MPNKASIGFERSRVLRTAALFGLALAASCSTTRDDFPELVGPPPSGSPDIDLSEYELTFNEEFDRRLDVSPWGCGTRWIAHTPWAGDFGDAKFSNPLRNFPFVVANGMLRIEASKDRGQWRSGLLSGGTNCDDGSDFRQKFGYFEARIRFPAGNGTWPAFWLIGEETLPEYKVEIDVVEYYGHRPDRYWSHTHIHPGENSNREKEGAGKTLDVAPSSLHDHFNTFGVSIQEDFTTFYFNRQEYWKIETRDEFKQPLYPLVNLALGSGYSIEKTPDPSFMYVDYVRIYQRKNKAISAGAGDRFASNDRAEVSATERE